MPPPIWPPSMRLSTSDADILEMKGGFLRVRPERIDCDLYRFLRGEPAAVRAYRGKYMSSYAWAALSVGRTNFYNG